MATGTAAAGTKDAKAPKAKAPAGGAVELTAEPRTAVGSKAAAKVRAKGQVPAVVYGEGGPTVPVALAAASLVHALDKRVRTIELVVAGVRQTVLVRAPQYDNLGDTLLHVDFLRVASDKAVEVDVEVVLRGTPIGEKEGGVLEQNLRSMRLACLPKDIPDHVVAVVDALKLGDVLRAKDLALPAGCTRVTGGDVAVATVHHAAGEATVAPADAAAAAPAEPEVIKPERKKDEDEAAEEGGKA